MTAGIFAKVKNVLGLIPGFFDKHLLEYRGVSWSIGGDSGKGHFLFVTHCYIWAFSG